MNGLVFVISFLLLAVANLRAASRCDPDGVFCDILKSVPKENCAPICITGCTCPKDHVLYDDVCIPARNCPPVCSGNMTFQARDITVRTCDNVYFEPKQPGCYCDGRSGYVLNRHTGECVLPQNCPKTLYCNQNEKEDNCKTNCPATCFDRNPSCTNTECERGCVCKPPFIRDTETGYCVQPKNCPDRCPEHEIYLTIEDCGTACQPFCGVEPPLPCTKNCVSGCFCKPGYTRECASKYSRCIPVEKCPLKVTYP